MAELILGPVVEATVSKLIDVASEQLSLARGWKQELRKFRGKMEMIQGVLQDADEKHVAGAPGLKEWLKQLQGVAEDAEELFQEVAYEKTRHKVASLYKPRWKEVSYYFTLSSSNPVVFRLKMANKVKSLISELADINESAKGFGLQKKLAAQASTPVRTVRQTQSLPSSYVIGRDQDVDAIVSMLTDSSSGQKQLPVISIVGMGGLGKTTVAQKVRVSDKICGHFSKIMWVCVSENFEVGGILREMLESLTKTTCAITNRDTLVQEVKQKLAGGTYLLILDDVWNEDGEKWDDLRDCLLAATGTNLGSRVVVTTRSEKVAGIMGTHHHHLHRLKGLEDDQCLEIIMKMSFGDYSSISSELMEIGRAIAEKCGGVPLVASVIGGTLCNNFDRNEWLSIRNKIDARGSLGEERDRRIVNILKLSFHRLPKPALKQCFVFCSAFPKDFVMEKESLVQLWMAEGYLSPSGKGVSMEDMGGEYFNDLIAYSLFQEEERDSLGNVSACKLHDLVHDLASSITEGETVTFGVGSQNEVSEQVRHLNLTGGGVPTNYGDVAENLRTLFLMDNCPSNLLKNSRRLRVFRLCDTDAEQLPLCLSKSKHLSFLDILGTRVKELPEFISKLYNLQTLKYMDCRNLEGPPVGIENLLNLRHLYFDREEVMPANIGRLVNLQTLKVFFVGREKGFRIEELGSLSQLRGELEIRNLGRVGDRLEAERAKLQEKEIEVLSLIFDSEREGSNHDEDVLEGLRPPSTLKVLSIEGYGGGNLPSWVSEMKNLVELKIYSCKMLKGVPPLDGFPCLQRLVIMYCDELSMIGDGEIVPNTSRLEELDIDSCPKLETVSLDGFSRLRELSIDECNKLSSIKGSISTSTSYCTALESLSLRSCGNLGCIPDLDGLTSLKRIYIRRCDQLELLPSGLSSCTALESLTAESCKSLKCIPSLDGLTSLRTVEIEECDQLELLPDNLSSCAALESLKVRKCKNLKNIPSLDGLTSLRTVEIERCDQLELLPDNLSSCAALESLKVRKCKNLKNIPSLDGLTSLRTVEIEECDQLELLPDNLSSCAALESLKVRKCKNLRFQGLDVLSLKYLYIGECDQLECLPSGLSSCTVLEKLEIQDCENLVFAPKELEALRSLVHLEINNCQKLKGNPTSPEESEIEGLTSLGSVKKLKMRSYSAGLEAFLSSILCLFSIEELDLSAAWNAFPPLPQHVRCYTSLKVLTIKGCQVESLPPLQPSPHGLGELSSLTKLVIRNCDLISIPEGLKELPSLVELDIFDYRILRSFPAAAESNFSCLTSLRRLTLGRLSDDLEEFPDLSSFPPTPNLEYLKLDGWSKVTQLPHQIIQHLGGGEGASSSSLKELVIGNFEGLEALPEWLGNLSSLQSLEISSCSNLKHLPSAEAIQRLTKLHRLEILGCSVLEERCKGPEWSKISHIPNIKISGIQIKSDDRASFI